MDLIDDELDGEYISYYDTNDISIKSNYSKGLYHGKCTYYYKSRRKYVEGNYVNGEREGYWFYYKDEENSVPEIKYYKDGEECDPPLMEVKNARKKV